MEAILKEIIKELVEVFSALRLSKVHRVHALKVGLDR